MTMLSLFVVVLLMVVGTHQHGMLMDPVNRASMWRLGYNTPANYDDNQLWCGGRHAQWDVNGGRCGECGDSYSLSRPRPHENGGRYGTGRVVQNYNAGATIRTVAKITANHRGHFYYRICPLSSASQRETEECFARYPLRLSDGRDVYWLPNSNNQDFVVNLVLPSSLRCDRCVLQWTYVAGNSWGVCSNGTGALGCGPQENYRTCSDISIS